eukprot:764824-Hanusia_phi.AAC.1
MSNQINQFIVVFVIAATLCGNTSATCFEDPKVDACADPSTYYNSSSMMADMNSLCTSMAWMTGCKVYSIRNDCNSKTLTGVYCEQWSLLSDVCDTSTGEDMSMMTGCKNNYNKARLLSAISELYS